MKILALLLLPIYLFSNFFEERIAFAKEGDFVIYEKDKNSSLLIFQKISDNKIILEEVTFPSYIKNKITDPKVWLDRKAPGHTAWRAYTIDRKSLDLIEAYSYKDKGHLVIDEKNFFLSKLLLLDLKEVPPLKRRKTGDYTMKEKRPDWNPPVVIDGIKQKKPCKAFYATWPKDGSKLENKKIELYFAQETFFPYWIELEAARVNIPFKVSNSGNKNFTKNLPPKRTPFFTKRPLPVKEKILTEAMIPKAYQTFDLFIIEPNKGPKPISYKSHIKGEMVKIFVDTKEIEKEKFYTLVLLPKSDPTLSCEISFSY
jgi:hypothetical protein